MFKNGICIEIEDLHSGTKTLTGQGNFANWKEAEARCEKLNDYYAEKAEPKIARVIYG